MVNFMRTRRIYHGLVLFTHRRHFRDHMGHRAQIFPGVHPALAFAGNYRRAHRQLRLFSQSGSDAAHRHRLRCLDRYRRRRDFNPGHHPVPRTPARLPHLFPGPAPGRDYRFKNNRQLKQPPPGKV